MTKNRYVVWLSGIYRYPRRRGKATTIARARELARKVAMREGTRLGSKWSVYVTDKKGRFVHACERENEWAWQWLRQQPTVAQVGWW